MDQVVSHFCFPEATETFGLIKVKTKKQIDITIVRLETNFYGLLFLYINELKNWHLWSSNEISDFLSYLVFSSLWWLFIGGD